MGGSRDSPTGTNLDDRTGRYPWVKVVEAGTSRRDAERVLALTRQEAERIAREHEEAKQYRSALNQDKATADELDRAARGSRRGKSERQHRLKDPSTL